MKPTNFHWDAHKKEITGIFLLVHVTVTRLFIEIINVKLKILTSWWKTTITRPAKCKPAFLQEIAVIIMCEPSRECTKFGGKAVFCRLTETC